MFFIDDTWKLRKCKTTWLGFGIAAQCEARSAAADANAWWQPPTLQLSFQWSLSSREAENDNPTAHFALAHTSRCMYCAQVHGFLLSCFLFCEVSFLPETPFPPPQPTSNKAGFLRARPPCQVFPVDCFRRLQKLIGQMQTFLAHE